MMYLFGVPVMMQWENRATNVDISESGSVAVLKQMQVTYLSVLPSFLFSDVVCALQFKGVFKEW